MILTVAAEEDGVLCVNPKQSLGDVRRALQKDPKIRRVIFEAGHYRGGLSLKTPKGVDPKENPLIIQAAENAKVIFDGSITITGAQPTPKHKNIYQLPWNQQQNPAPKLWEPDTRVRYSHVAGLKSVEFFPASYCVENGMLYFHTSDSDSPGERTIEASSADYGVFVNRPYVTIKGISFINYRRREKWSTGMDLRADNITVENCEAVNCSMGFIVNGNNCGILKCRVEDSGCAIYVQGENTKVENCRLFKKRDAFMVPMYPQDDTGIQYYYPAKGGVIRNNLCVGFAKGIFIKASRAAYIIKHNTLIGYNNSGTGFGATKWHPEEQFQFNIICDFLKPIEIPTTANAKLVGYNCYWPEVEKNLKPIGGNNIPAPPKFVWPELQDFRLLNDSPYLKIKDGGAPCGAFPAIGENKIAVDEPRQWYVSSKGRDGLDGSKEKPVKTIQYAVARAKPGDTINVMPGIYPAPIVFTRGGTKEHPITLRSTEKRQAILDSNRKSKYMISVRRAPYIEIKNFEIRWYGSVGISIKNSPHCTVTGCKIWNAHWTGSWPTGSAVRVEWSPYFEATDNICFRQEHAFWLYFSPNSVINHNTCVANLYSGAAFYYSIKGSTCKNNSFTFQGNDSLVINEHKGMKKLLSEFDCDYNNYGTKLRKQQKGTVFDSFNLRQQDKHLDIGSKAIFNYTDGKGNMNRMKSMKSWRDFSGVDKNSIFADPLYKNVRKQDFTLENNSPNNNAGENKATLGARRQGKGR